MKKSMKISKKLIVSALSTGMGVSLVGAITGTVAWYQYSTRSTVSFVGTSVGTSENLLVSLNNVDYDHDLTHDQIATALGDTTLAPVTSCDMGAEAALPEHFKAQPIYQHFAYNQWVDAENNAFVQLNIYLKLNKLNEQGQEVPIDEQRNVYLSDLLIRKDKADTEHSDISDAVRVQLHTNDADILLSKKGETINVNGELDLNGDDNLDTVEPIYSFYDQDDLAALTTGTYGFGTQTAYEINNVKPIADAHGALSGGKVLGTLYSRAVKPAAGPDAEHPNILDDTYFLDPELENSAAGETADGLTTYYVRQDVLTLTVTIWLEGWQQLIVDGQSVSVRPAQGVVLDNGDYYTDAALTEHATGTANGTTDYFSHKLDSIWDPAKYVGSVFDVGLLFEVDA